MRSMKESLYLGERQLNIKETAELLGVSYGFFRKLIAQGGEIPPHYKIGTMMRFPEKGVLQWLQDRTR